MSVSVKWNFPRENTVQQGRHRPQGRYSRTLSVSLSNQHFTQSHGSNYPALRAKKERNFVLEAKATSALMKSLFGNISDHLLFTRCD